MAGPRLGTGNAGTSGGALVRRTLTALSLTTARPLADAVPNLGKVMTGSDTTKPSTPTDLTATEADTTKPSVPTNLTAGNQ